MSNIQPERDGLPQPKLKKMWQRIVVYWGLGIILGLLVWWALSGFDPDRITYIYNWRRELTRLMLKIASPESWFWIVLILYLLIGATEELYLRGYWPYGTKLDKKLRQMTKGK